MLKIPEDLPNAVVWNTTRDHASKTNENKQYKRLMAEFHTHTRSSDGELSPGQVVDWARAYGFSLLFVTDHNTVEGGRRAANWVWQHGLENEIKVIPGVEYTCCRIHMNLLGINETIRPTEAWPSDSELREVIEKTHELGGIVVVNHLPWSCSTEGGRHVARLQDHPSPQDLVEWGVDAFESVAEGVLDLPTLRFVEANGMPYITATDLHTPDVAPNAWTTLDLDINSDTPLSEVSDATVIEAIARRHSSNTNFYYDPIGPVKERVYPPPNPAYSWYAAFTDIFDFTVFWTERRGLYSFTPWDNGHSFCHAAKFEFHYLTMFAFVFNTFLVFVVFEIALAYFYIRS